MIFPWKGFPIPAGICTKPSTANGVSTDWIFIEDKILSQGEAKHDRSGMGNAILYARLTPACCSGMDVTINYFKGLFPCIFSGAVAGAGAEFG